MKRILLLTVTMVFALAWSAIRADAMTGMSGEMSGKALHNGITDFSGSTYDSVGIPSALPRVHAAGGC